MKNNTFYSCSFSTAKLAIAFISALLMSNTSAASSQENMNHVATPTLNNISIFSDKALPEQNNLTLFAQVDNNKTTNETLTNPSLSDNEETLAIEANNASDDVEETKPSLWQRFKRNVALTWDSPTKDFYLPVNTWHNRLVYSDEDVDRYNEFPVGAGFGYSRYDEDGDWHSLYALGFSDSNYEFEPFVGYGYEKQWGKPSGWHYGLGFTLAITAREEMGYIPIPIILPLASIGYKRVTLQSSYVPGSSSNGNVLFTWVRFQLN